ncbi:MAG: division/cell wall cluster transcriptional repressor MraZ [Candidatus Pacebacteria bacterium]|nr:division/cell wall cluster transcriptional repressor MraZ [Candidatus Paceibacterota bacterium]
MFIGEYSYNIDQKKRLSVPAKFRKDLGKEAVITKGIDNCLILYPLKVWEQKTKQLESMPTAKKEAREFARIMLSGASEVELDKLGRILIPDFLKDYALLEKNVCILGLSNKIEIWDEKRWQDHKKKTEKEVGDIASRLEELGI